MNNLRTLRVPGNLLCHTEAEDHSVQPNVKESHFWQGFCGNKLAIKKKGGFIFGGKSSHPSATRTKLRYKDFLRVDTRFDSHDISRDNQLPSLATWNITVDFAHKMESPKPQQWERKKCAKNSHSKNLSFCSPIIARTENV